MELWSGRFHSTYVYGVKGIIEVQLNENIEKIGYDAPFKCEYIGQYRSGSIESGTVTVEEKEMKTTFTGSRQTITFNIESKCKHRIRGTYKSTLPDDEGNFELVPGTLQPQEICILL